MKKLLHFLLVFSFYLLPFSVSAQNDLYYNVVSYQSRKVEVTFPNSQQTIIWEGYTMPSGFVYIPDSVDYEGKKYIVSEISAWAFKGCEAITGVHFPGNLRNIGFSAFACCNGLVSIELPPSVAYIGGCAFYGCRNLEQVAIPPQVKAIKGYTFADCSSLRTLALPTSLEYIFKSAFDGSGLESVTIPAKVLFIDDHAFHHCTSLSRVEVLTTVPPTLGTDVFSDIHPQAILVVPQGSREAFLNAEGWNLFSQIVEK